MENQVDFNYQQEIERLKEKFGFDYIGIALAQSLEHRFEMKWMYVTGNLSEQYRLLKVQYGKGVAGVVFKTGKPMFVEDAEQALSGDNLFNYPIVVAEGLKSFGAIPLYKNNRVNGVMLVGNRKRLALTSEGFAQFKKVTGKEFGQSFQEEMVKNESDQ